MTGKNAAMAARIFVGVPMRIQLFFHVFMYCFWSMSKRSFLLANQNRCCDTDDQCNAERIFCDFRNLGNKQLVDQNHTQRACKDGGQVAYADGRAAFGIEAFRHNGVGVQIAENADGAGGRHRCQPFGVAAGKLVAELFKTRGGNACEQQLACAVQRHGKPRNGKNLQCIAVTAERNAGSGSADDGKTQP